MTAPSDPVPETPMRRFAAAGVDLHPRRFRLRLMRWLAASAAVHVLAIAALAVSPALRRIVFQGFEARDPSVNLTDSQVQAAKLALDMLTRKRLIGCQERMLSVSTRLLDLRRRHWDEVASRGRDNPGFAAMHQGGLPALELIAAPGRMAEAVPLLYDQCRRFESQAISLYEHSKALGLSLKTVALGSGSGEPQGFERSLDLVRLERPQRRGLDTRLLDAPIRGLQDGSWKAWRAEMTEAGDTAELMANNCDRIMQVIESIEVMIDSGSSGLAGTGKGAENVPTDVPYRGDQLRPVDIYASKLQSLDPQAKIELGKHLGEAALSRSAEWVAIHTWWQLGPFPYLGGARTTQSLNHAYPPEYGIDLDAVYEGRDGRRLAWFYSPMSSVRMEPRDVQRQSIWYFYTQFHSDRAQTVYANVASDDYGVLWLNGQKDPVYRSPMEPRPWVALDKSQFVRLDLRKGANALLLKLDNNRGTTGFTIAFALADIGQ